MPPSLSKSAKFNSRHRTISSAPWSQQRWPTTIYCESFSYRAGFTTLLHPHQCILALLTVLLYITSFLWPRRVHSILGPLWWTRRVRCLWWLTRSFWDYEDNIGWCTLWSIPQSNLIPSWWMILGHGSPEITSGLPIPAEHHQTLRLPSRGYPDYPMAGHQYTTGREWFWWSA